MNVKLFAGGWRRVGGFPHPPYEFFLTAVMDRSRKDCLTFCLGNRSLCVFRQEIMAGDVLLVQVVNNEALGVCVCVWGDGFLSLVMVCSKTHPDFSQWPFLLRHWPTDATADAQRIVVSTGFILKFL